LILGDPTGSDHPTDINFPELSMDDILPHDIKQANFIWDLIIQVNHSMRNI
jgi:hypothetical protein